MSAEIEDGETEDTYNEFATQVISEDMGRMIRKDMTVLSEMVAKYRGVHVTKAMALGENDAVTKELGDIETSLVNARQALSHVMDLISE